VRPDDVLAAALSALERHSVRATEALKRAVEPQYLLPSAYGMYALPFETLLLSRAPGH